MSPLTPADIFTSEIDIAGDLEFDSTKTSDAAQSAAYRACRGWYNGGTRDRVQFEKRALTTVAKWRKRFGLTDLRVLKCRAPNCIGTLHACSTGEPDVHCNICEMVVPLYQVRARRPLP